MVYVRIMGLKYSKNRNKKRISFSSKRFGFSKTWYSKNKRRRF